MQWPLHRLPSSMDSIGSSGVRRTGLVTTPIFRVLFSGVCCFLSPIFHTIRGRPMSAAETRD